MSTELTRAVARLLLLPILVVAVAMLVHSYAGTGDGFSAGAIAALGVLLQYLVLGYEETERRLPARLGPSSALVGLLAAVVVGFAPVLASEPPVTHLPRPGAHVTRLGSLELHTALLLDSAIFLLVFGFALGVMRVVARREASRRRREEDG